MKKQIKLPKGYYAVAPMAEDAKKSSFIYKGTEYSAEPGVNLFSCLNDAYVAATEIPESVISGLDYEKFDTPVVLLLGGRHLYNNGTPNSRSVKVDHSVAILGEGASVNPNLNSSDEEAPPVLNPAREENETVLVGSFWWGRFIIGAECGVDRIIFDGLTLSAMCLEDMREVGPTDAYISFRNIIHQSPMFRTMYKILPPKENSSLHRRVEIINLRIHNMDDADYGNYFMTPAVDELIIDGAVVDTTTQIFGFTTIYGGLSNMPKNAENAKITVKNSYFRRLLGENSIRTSLFDIGERSFTFEICDSRFYDCSRQGESALTLDVPTDKVSIIIKNTSFNGTEENSASAVKLVGGGKNVIIEGSSFSGYQTLSSQNETAVQSIPKKIENRSCDWESGCEDSHTVIAEGKADFSSLLKLYEGKRAYYGDLHVHTACGGTSDGRYPMSDWPSAMDEVELDFAAVVDHMQMRGFFLPEWNDERFIIGTEPAAEITDLRSCRHGLREMHYNMLFPNKYGLAMVMANFPEFCFKGDELSGRYKYPSFTKKRFSELVEFIYSIGGAVVHPHPKMMICSSDPLDYYIGEFTFLETLYDRYDSNWSARNYDLWKKLLALGKHVYASGGSDTHGPVRSDTVSVFYSKERFGKTFLEIMKRGDFSVGAVGIQMAIADAPMGSVTEFHEGDTLTVRIGDFFERTHQKNCEYEIRIITDKGIAYASRYDGVLPQSVALKIKNRKFYRVEIFDITHGYVVSHSNPIWLDL